MQQISEYSIVRDEDIVEIPLGNSLGSIDTEVTNQFKEYAIEMLNSFFAGENKAGETYTMDNVHSEVKAYDDILEEFGFDNNFEKEFLLPEMEKRTEQEEQGEQGEYYNYQEIIGELQHRDMTKNVLHEDIGFDKKHKKNADQRLISQDILDNINENGITIEQIDKLDFPIFKYKTQITIHGIFDGDINPRAGSYFHAFTLNKNKSLGVKYVAIDGKKKQKIAQILRDYDEYNEYNNTFFKSRITATQGQILSLSREITKENINELQEEMNGIYANITKNILSKNTVYFLRGWFGLEYVLEIKLDAIYQKDFWNFISFLTKNKINNAEDHEQLILSNEKKNEIKEAERERKEKIEEDREYTKLAPARAKAEIVIEDYKKELVTGERFGGHEKLIQVLNQQGNSFLTALQISTYMLVDEPTLLISVLHYSKSDRQKLMKRASDTNYIPFETSIDDIKRIIQEMSIRVKSKEKKSMDKWDLLTIKQEFGEMLVFEQNAPKNTNTPTNTSNPKSILQSENYEVKEVLVNTKRGQKRTIRIVFKERPNEQVRSWLKSNGFRFYRYEGGYWGSFYTHEKINLLNKGIG